MKRIAFFVQQMMCAGVETALIALSKALNAVGNDVTIYVVRESGDFLHQIPEGVKLNRIPLSDKMAKILPIGGTKLTIHKNLKEHHYVRAGINLINHYFGKSGFAELNVDFNKIPSLDEEYDIAVNFHMHSPFLVRYLSEKVKARRKLSWIHNDFTTTGYDIKKLQRYLDCCEGFYCVSKRLSDEFITIFPEYSERTDVIYNIVPANEILERAEGSAPEYENIPDDYLKLLSVGRLEEQKGFDLSVSVCKKLLDAGYKFKWFILGEGTERGHLEKMIRSQGLADTLFLEGIRLNPYPYFKNCDVYVQTSRHEGYATTVTEAKIFSRPVVCTEVAGAREQIQDGINGYVTEFDADAVAEKIKEIIRLRANQKSFVSADLQDNISANLRVFM